MFAKFKDCSEKENQLNIKQKILIKKEEQLKEKEEQLNKKETFMSEKERELNEIEKELSGIEKELNKREIIKEDFTEKGARKVEFVIVVAIITIALAGFSYL